ncbi:50S ribosomal protein L3, partial [Candidatus Woesearchaeota archaeon]|nr:50S ribosomal protein L3 [Candidatus Woesearchaeota archaeon]
LLGFAGYKAGMTHVIATDNRKNSTSKGQDMVMPVTIIECPPIRIHAIRAHVAEGYGTKVVKEIKLDTDKFLSRKLDLPKTLKADLHALSPENYSEFSILAYTQPNKIGFKKKPDVIELRLGGKPEDQLAFIKEHVGKDIAVSDIFGEGDLVDTHAITKGRGFQGAVRRFGIGLKSHKSEKGRRTPGSLGGWKGHAHFMYRVAHAGQMGFHQRVQYNNIILKISDNPEEVHIKGGIVNYGNVKNTYILVKGTVQGAKKRLIVLTKAIRPKVKIPLPTLKTISTESKQGR